MGWYQRLSNAFRDAPVLPLDCGSRLVLFSDCHRGVGNSNDISTCTLRRFSIIFKKDIRIWSLETATSCGKTVPSPGS